MKHYPSRQLLALFSVLAIACALIVWLSCTVASAQVGPSVRITSPEDGITVFGTEYYIVVDYKSNSNLKVVRIQVLIDEGLQADYVLPAPKQAGTQAFKWDTTRFNDGLHKVAAIAFDSAGRRGSAQVSVYVKNAAAGGGSDIIPPDVRIYAPAQGAVLKGAVRIGVQATDDNGVDWVLFFIDEAFAAGTNHPPYAHDWDTTKVANGPHRIYAMAVDQAGNETKSQEVTVIVSNPSGETRAPSVPAAAPQQPVTTEPTPSAGSSKVSPPPTSLPAEAAPKVTQPTPKRPSRLPAASSSAATGPAQRGGRDTGVPKADGLGPGANKTTTPQEKPTLRAAVPKVTTPKVSIATPAAGPGSAARSAPGRQPATPAKPVMAKISAPPAAGRPFPVAAPVYNSHVFIPSEPAIARAPLAEVDASARMSQPSPSAVIRAKGGPPPSAGRQRIAMAPRPAPAITPQAGQPMGEQGEPKVSTPTAAVPRPMHIVHTVAPGETLTGIAAHYNVSLAALVKANQIRDRNVIHIGDKLFVPVGSALSAVTADEIKIIFDNQELKLRALAEVRNGIEITPLREIFEHQNGVLFWYPVQKRVRAVNKTKDVEIKIGSATVKVNNEPVVLELAPFIKRGRTMVPLTFVKDLLDVTVQYDPANGRIYITSNKL